MAQIVAEITGPQIAEVLAEDPETAAYCFECFPSALPVGQQRSEFFCEISHYADRPNLRTKTIEFLKQLVEYLEADQ